jgi:hypothetical protein
MVIKVKLLRQIKAFIFEFVYSVIPAVVLKRWASGSDDNWLFIIGCNNSGTTLLKTIIESHPNVIGIEGEGQYRTNQFMTDREIGLNRLFSERLDIFREVSDVDPLRVKYDWLVSLIRRKRSFHQYVLEKTTVNAVRVPWLHENFPKAKFIVIFREAYAVVEGMKRKENISIERGAEHWDRTNRLIIDDFEGFENVLYLSYEHLTNHPDHEIRKIWKFLNLNFAEKVHQYNYTVHGNESGIVNQNPKSLKRLSKSELETISMATSSTLLKIADCYDRN